MDKLEEPRISNRSLPDEGAFDPQMKAIIDSIPTIVWCNRPDGSNEFLSKRWHEYTGLSEEESRTWGWQAAFHADDLRSLMDRWQKHLPSGESSEIEARIRSKHGVFRWFLIRFEALRDEVGNIKRWYGTGTDIDDRKRAEEAARDLYSELQERDGRIRRLVDANIIGVLVSNSESQIIECNDAFLKMVGYTREELIDGCLHWRTMTPPEWKDASDDGVRQTTTTGICRVFEKEYYRKDGSRVPVLVGAARYKNDSIVAFTIDLTERKRVEEAFRRSEAYLADTQKLSGTGSWAWSPEAGIKYWSAECYRVQGFDPKFGLPQWEELFQRVHPDDRTEWMERRRRVLREKIKFETEYRLILPDGAVRDIHSTGYPVLGASGDLIELIGTVIDITERKKAEALLTGEKRLHEMIATSVPLKEILNALCLMIEGQCLNTLASVLLPSSDGIHLESLAGPSLPEGWTRQIAKLPIGPCAGSCGTAAYRRSPVMVSDIATDPLWAVTDHRVSALRYGLRASWSYPILTAEGEVLGILCLYYREIRSPKPSDLALVELAVHLARVAIQRKVGEEKLQRSEMYLSEAQRISHIGSWSFNAAGFGHWSPELFKIHGLDAGGKAPSTQEYLALVHPEDRHAVAQEIDKALTGADGFDITKRIVRPDGAIRHIRCVAIRATTGGIVGELVGTGMDVTEQKEAEEEREKHLWFLECMDRVNRAMQCTNDSEGMMSGVLEETLAIFGGDRAWLFYPCDPDSPTCRAVMEHTRPEYPGAFALCEVFPVDTSTAVLFRRVLNSPGATTDLSIAPETRERFNIQSIIAIAVRPKGDRPYLFGLHQCSHARVWTAAESRLFEEIARRLEDALTSVLAHRNLLIRERELQRSQHHLVEGERLSHTGTITWNIITGEQTWSEENYRILGYEGAIKPTFERIRDRIHPEDLLFWQQTMARALKGERIDIEHRLLMPDGTVKNLHVVAGGVQKDGEVVELAGTARDITERRRAEEAIRRSEAFLAEGQRLSHTGSWSWNTATGKVMWSQELFRILDLDPQGTNPSLDAFWERILPEDRIITRCAFESAVRDKRNFEQEFRILTPGGSIRHLHGVGHAVLDEVNQLVEFIGTAMDTTEKKHAEGRAQSQREAIRLALNAFIEKLDANRLLEDIVAETTKRFNPNSWELWLFDEAVGAYLLHSSWKAGESLRLGTDRKNVRPLEELRGIWQLRNPVRAPQIFQLPNEKPALGERWIKSLNSRGIKTLMFVPLVLGEQILGLVELHFDSSVHFTSEDLELAQSLGNHATLALQLSRLTRRGEQLAVTEERNRMAREIHDTMAQAFAGIMLHSEALSASLGVSKRRSRIALLQVQKLARSGLDEARRSVQALRPRALEGCTFSQALEQMAISIAESGNLSCHFRQSGEVQTLHREAQDELFRIAQEALTNVAKHARATSVWINLTFKGRQVSLAIRDDGIGLALKASRKPNSSYGLASMRERTQRIGGRIQIKSKKNGGTSVRVQIPLVKNT
jgi:PAS domain S-box-containing protein